MKMSRARLLALLLGVVTVLTVAVRGSNESGDWDYRALLDRFEVTGPGAWSPGWFDDFDNGLPDGWTNMGAFGPIGAWHDEPGTSFAWLEGPGGDQNVPASGVHWYRTTLFSYQIGQSFVSAGNGYFQGTATFAAELPQLNQYHWLILNFPRSIDGKSYQEQVHATITNYAPEVAAILGLSGGLRVEQKSYLYDAVTWQSVKTIDFRTKAITAPASLGPVRLAIGYLDDAVNPRFLTGYSLTEPADFVASFLDNPIVSNLHLAPDGGWWSITSGLVVPIIPVDIKPGSCPNAVNPRSRGVLPVAFLGTARIDITIVDPETLVLRREGKEPGVAPVGWAYEDVATPLAAGAAPGQCHDLGGDGHLDLTLKFDMQEVASRLGEAGDGDTIKLVLTGRLKEEYGGTPVRGQDYALIRLK